MNFYGWQRLNGTWTQIRIDGRTGEERHTTYPGREWFINTRWIQRAHTMPRSHSHYDPRNLSRRNFFMRYW